MIRLNCEVIAPGTIEWDTRSDRWVFRNWYFKGGNITLNKVACDFFGFQDCSFNFTTMKED